MSNGLCAAQYAAIDDRTVLHMSYRREDLHNLRRRDNCRAFCSYLKGMLISTLRTGDIVVMDNTRSHHVKAVGELLRQNGIIPMYLPPTALI